MGCLQPNQDSLEPPALLIINAEMPEQIGYELVRRIRQSYAPETLPIVMFTSGGRPDEVESFSHLGIQRILIKPIRQDELVAAVRHALASQHGPSSRSTGWSSTSHRVSIPSLRVLLVEDSPTNRLLATRLLEKWGHQVQTAENGKVAVELVSSHDFDLILMDVQMPELDGIQATRRIRESERDSQSRIPIIALTAHAMSGDRDRCLNAGMDAYVTKPIRRVDLDTAIQKLMRPQVVKAELPDADVLREKEQN